MHASNEHSFIVRVPFGIYSLKAGWPGRLRLRASNEGFLKPRVARAREAGLPPRAPLLALNRKVHDVPLPIDEQECKVGRFQRVCETLEGCEIVDHLTIEFEHDVARLETGGFCQTAFFNVRHHHPAGDGQIHLPSQRRGHIVEDDAGEGMSRGS